VVTLSVRDEIGRRLVAFHLDAAGIGSTEHVSTRTVADSIPAEGSVDVLIVRPTRAALRQAAEQFMSGRARSIVVADRPDQVALALELLDDDLCVLPAAARQAYCEWPAITERDVQIWQAALAGQSNRVIAHGLGLSVITVKRRLASLCKQVGVGSRLELCAAGLHYGYEPRPLQR
jgi:DNA-binding NarL/FixJ family response regulator